VLGIKFDPFDSKRFASFSEDCIKIFDLRNTKRAIYSIKSNEVILGMEWCHYRPNLLSSFNKKSVILLWDINLYLECCELLGLKQKWNNIKRLTKLIINFKPRASSRNDYS
jgi:WD40 repeat protein